jgi:catechol 2,3-dioxygenase-like lactoylglutathione lyase family enzyme
MAAALPRLIGINHVALEVGDIEQALAFYGKIFRFTLRGRGKGQAFVDMGDQFLALMEVKEPHKDRQRHFGLVVDDRGEVKALAQAAGAKMVDGPFLDFLDPWGNRIEVVAYADIQLSKAPHVLRAMGLDGEKSAKARKEHSEKGMGMESDAKVSGRNAALDAPQIRRAD